jgi:hypothetical protein
VEEDTYKGVLMSGKVVKALALCLGLSTCIGITDSAGAADLSKYKRPLSIPFEGVTEYSFLILAFPVIII